MKHKVVVTGLGTVNPLGLNVDETWHSLVNAKSGITSLPELSEQGFATSIAGLVKNFDASQYFSPKEARKCDAFIQYATFAASEALEDAGLQQQLQELDLTRIGVAIGSGIGGINTIEANHKQLQKSGSRRVSPLLIPGSVINMASGSVAIRYGFKGPNFSISTACTTGTHNIGYAARTIAYGDADVMLAGGAEKACSPLGMAGFAAARAMSTNNDNPESASRPFDSARDGFVLSDGAAVLVLESLEHAQNRGATIYAELSGFGMSDDAFHITSPCENGEGAAMAMQNALDDANLNAQDIQYINAHGTSTLQGDIAETKAIKQVFKQHAYNLCVSSSKSMTGHLLGAAGAIEALISVLSLQHQTLVPTINLDHADPECDLDYVANKARTQEVHAVMSNSFGFGGTNGCLLFSRYES